MGILYDWIKNIVIYMILNTIINHLLGDSSYKKYIGIVSGMILVVIVISPILKFLKLEEGLNYSMGVYPFAVEASEFKNSLTRMEEDQQRELFREYTEQIRGKVEHMLKEEGVTLLTIAVDYNMDIESAGFGEILQMNIGVGYEEEKVSGGKRIVVDRIKIDSAGNQESFGEEDEVIALTPEQISIKNKLADFYNIEPNNINVSIQGG